MTKLEKRTEKENRTENATRMKILTSITSPFPNPHDPTSSSSPIPAALTSRSRTTTLMLPGGIPVIGSILALKCSKVHDGEIRRSDWICGGAEGSDDVEGTIIRRGTSAAVGLKVDVDIFKSNSTDEKRSDLFTVKIRMEAKSCSVVSRGRGKYHEVFEPDYISGGS